MSKGWEAALEVLVNEIIPNIDGTGAADAGLASELISYINGISPLKEQVMSGFNALQRASMVLGGKNFNELAKDQCHRIMEDLSKGIAPHGWTDRDPDPAKFWGTIRSLAVSRFLNSPEGMKLAGFPGPNVDQGGYRHTIVEAAPGQERSNSNARK